MLTEDCLQKLYRYSYTLTCNRQDAYDLLQCAIEKHLRSNESTNNQIAYIKRIIKNQHIDNYRHQKRLEFDRYEDTVIALDNELKELENMVINEDMVESILASLSTDEREIIYYWAYEGYTAQEISDILESPRGTILSKLHRIRKRIIKQFGNDINHCLEATQ